MFKNEGTQVMITVCGSKYERCMITSAYNDEDDFYLVNRQTVTSDFTKELSFN